MAADGVVTRPRSSLHLRRRRCRLSPDPTTASACDCRPVGAIAKQQMSLRQQAPTLLRLVQLLPASSASCAAQQRLQAAPLHGSTARRAESGGITGWLTSKVSG